MFQFPSLSPVDSAKTYWDKLGDPVTIQEYGIINSIDICPTDQTLVAATTLSKVQIYNTFSRELHKSITKFSNLDTFGGRWRKDGSLLCVGTSDGQVRVFDVNTKTMLRALKGHTTATRKCDFTEDTGGTGKGVVSWSDDKTVRVWDLPTETTVSTFTGHTDYVRAGSVVPVSPDLIISGSYDHSAMLWDKRIGSTDVPSIKFTHGSPIEASYVLPSGGLLVTAGGTQIKVWDLLSGGKLLASISPHHKTITSLCLSGAGKYLVSGSLDRQVHWIDLASFKTVYTMQYPASVMAVGVAGDDSCVVTGMMPRPGMMDGLVQIHTRKVEEIKDGVRTDTRRYKKATSHRYLQYTAFTPSPGDQVVGQDKKDIELRHDYLLRKFEYSRALDAVLKPYVARVKPEYTYSLLMELSRREGLKTALAGREEKGLGSILQFVNKYISDSRFSKLLIHVADLLMDLYLPEHGMSSQVDRQFQQLKAKLEKEITYCEELMQLQGAVDLILSAANSGRTELQSVQHIVAKEGHFNAVKPA